MIMKGSSIAIWILEWMACLYRPLRAYEILDSIAFKPGCTSLNARTKVYREVLNLCRPLIGDDLSDAFEFVHFSAKRYEHYKDADAHHRSTNVDLLQLYTWREGPRNKPYYQPGRCTFQYLLLLCGLPEDWLHSTASSLNQWRESHHSCPRVSWTSALRQPILGWLSPIILYPSLASSGSKFPRKKIPLSIFILLFYRICH